MDVNWDHVRFTSKIGALTRDYLVSNFKIGITGDPERRAHEYGEFYGEMVVLYETRSEAHVRDSERDLTSLYEGYCDNSITGGGGTLGGPPYYLYLVRRHRDS